MKLAASWLDAPSEDKGATLRQENHSQPGPHFTDPEATASTVRWPSQRQAWDG